MKDDEFDIKQEYNKLKHLPKFEDLDYEFEFSLNIKNKEFLIRNIRRKMNEKVILY